MNEVGPGLRKVRSARGLTLDEAARDTRIRREFLEALEEEDFGRLLGDVHVRGCLRTYASYLRLSPDKVVSAYAAYHPQVPTITPPAGPIQPEPMLGGGRRRDDHRLIVMVAATLLVLAGAFGILSARQPAPPPAELSSEPPAPAAAGSGVTVAVLAREPVDVTIVADGGQAETFRLEAGEGRSFDGDRTIRVRLSRGGAAQVSVNGTDKGFPGRPDRPWRGTFGYLSSEPSPPPPG